MKKISLLAVAFVLGTNGVLLSQGGNEVPPEDGSTWDTFTCSVTYPGEPPVYWGACKVPTTNGPCDRIKWCLDGWPG